MAARYYWLIVIFICMVLHCRFLYFLLRGLCVIRVWGVSVASIYTKCTVNTILNTEHVILLYAAAIYWRKLNRDERRYMFVARVGGVFVLKWRSV
jgi:hypothetical protein